ncbi:hypothetical protein [Streptomyces sp.]|uniref:hypothetical protein n=1 Tax=Streptomyces sp. TaxID=1931 RepID=UPI002F3E5D25
MALASGQQQQSSTATYGQAIQSLENARDRITAIQGQVQQAKAALQTQYQGPDGHAYAQVMDTWLQETERIKGTCAAMENELGISLQASNNVQASNYQAVVDQGKLTSFGGSVEHGTYSALTGG